MSQKDLDKLFRDALGEGRAQPRPDSWARVAAGIPQAPAAPKRRVLWYRYAAAASVVLAASGFWRWTQVNDAGRIPSEIAVGSSAESAVTAVTQIPQTDRDATSPTSVANESRTPQPRGSVRLAASIPPSPEVHLESPPTASWTLAYLEPFERSIQDDAVPLLERRAAAPADLAVAKQQIPRYRQLASDVSQVWTAVNAYRSGEAQPQVTVEVHVPASVLQRVQQTKLLAQNFNQSWSTFLPKRSH